ncbi:MAG: hypothetical protein HYS70_04415 [Nitrospinae bacterium]|nr:hypothetical protein [Nitrospinota bacterium]
MSRIGLRNDLSTPMKSQVPLGRGNIWTRAAMVTAVRRRGRMPFTVEEFRDLVRILEERPEWRVELRRLVLTDELLSLPEQVASLRAETERRFQELIEAQRRTEGRVAELAEAQRRVEGQVAELTIALHTLTNEVGELKGDSLERRYRERAPAYLARLVRRAQVLSTEALSFLLEEAVERGELSEAEAEDVTWADLVVRGRRREDGAEVYVVVEVSWGVGPQDVERAVRKAALLAKVGTPALPVVAGKRVTDKAAHLARTMKVWQLIDGQATSPEPSSERS